MTGLGVCAFYPFVPSHTCLFLTTSFLVCALESIKSEIHVILSEAKDSVVTSDKSYLQVQNMFIYWLKNYCESSIFLKGGRSRIYVEQNVFYKEVSCV